MASRQGYLVNNVDPSKVFGQGVDVAEGAVRVTCAGLGLPGAAWQVRVGTAANGAWENVVRFGVPIILSDNNTQYIEVVAGTYRVAPTTLPNAAQVWFQEDEVTTSDARTTYIFGQENTNQNGITGNSTASIQMSGNGTVAAPLGLDVKYSTDGNNLAHAGTDGAVEATLITNNTQTIDLSGAGTSTNALTASVNISTTVGNTLTTHSDGLFVPSASTSVVTTDSTSAHLSGAGTIASPLIATYFPATSDFTADATAILVNPILTVQYNTGTGNVPATTNINSLTNVSRDTLYFETLVNGPNGIGVSAVAAATLNNGGRTYKLVSITGYTGSVANNIWIQVLMQAQTLNAEISDGSSTPIAIPLVIQTAYALDN